MRPSLHAHIDSIRGFLTGFLIIFSLFILNELKDSWVHMTFAVIAIGGAIWLAKKTKRHFHGAHTHTGDSAFDVVGPLLLFTTNILHPAVDGFSVYETFTRAGHTAGIVALVGIVLHEVIRQWALIVALAKMNIRRGGAIVLTALLGLLIGVGLGAFGTRVLQDNEGIIDIATLFAYAFIIAEFWQESHTEKKKGKWLVVLLGIAAGAVYLVVFQG